jgi:hypothetical protein
MASLAGRKFRDICAVLPKLLVKILVEQQSMQAPSTLEGRASIVSVLQFLVQSFGSIIHGFAIHNTYALSASVRSLNICWRDPTIKIACTPQDVCVELGINVHFPDHERQPARSKDCDAITDGRCVRRKTHPHTFRNEESLAACDTPDPGVPILQGVVFPFRRGSFGDLPRSTDGSIPEKESIFWGKPFVPQG